MTVLRERYAKSMSLREAEDLAAEILKQVMEAKIGTDNIEFALVSAESKKWTVYDSKQIQSNLNKQHETLHIFKLGSFFVDLIFSSIWYNSQFKFFLKINEKNFDDKIKAEMKWRFKISTQAFNTGKDTSKPTFHILLNENNTTKTSMCQLEYSMWRVLIEQTQNSTWSKSTYIEERDRGTDLKEITLTEKCAFKLVRESEQNNSKKNKNNNVEIKLQIISN
ncbi:proteasome subunit alpha type 5 [Reticulomyxa filosa]|uniref:Proteasome subunit alpha type 5 n=1 Tax=Reticulomyxa filosa TaxID=46433 RepID=X6PBF4_RETFI|nr:proteasome subunit alpha type 5 [Reticulomyxa filosa]|eukprot:ETO35369.1 proteasome subunit alpha type 5 [Reticulomyxa filosa]